MIVDRHDPVNLFEMVPKLKLQFEPELAELDRLLDDDTIFREGQSGSLPSVSQLGEAWTALHAG